MRPIWKGTLGFGLVSIPVAVYPAEASETRVSFHLLDGRTMEPVRNRRVNERTGDEVPYEEIVKGYEVERGEWVVVTDEEIRSALPESTGTIDIAEFVAEDAIDPTFYGKPYYVEPEKSGRKAFALLREVMRRDEYVAVGHFVLRTKRYLVAIAPRGDVLVMSLLRYAHELRDPGELDLPGDDLTADGVTDKELAMAEQLVSAMAEEWDAAAFKDDYHDKIREIIRMKAETGQVTAIEEAPEAGAGAGKVVDIMELLKRSLEREEAAASDVKASEPRSAERKKA
jgi:DNA end-binding protein Ku